jgi:hypothetical protein
MPGCRSGEGNEDLPDVFDWRKENPDCEIDSRPMPKDCGASYVYASLSAVSDHICKAT